MEMYRGGVKHALRLGLLLVAFVFALSESLTTKISF